ncbi:MAG: hypothetical protein DRI26_04195 [Chloroflexi bacterium]|nr:MAG: hypothetical protein DRI26_04195 [Chloroflexota bacterium]
MKEMELNQAIELGSPYPYTLVVTLNREGRPNVMGLSWWTFTSLQPPMLAIAVGHSRYTHECLEACPEFVLCFPAEEQAQAAWICGTKSGRNADKLALAGLRTLPARQVRPPLLEGCTLAYECRVVGRLECSDHTLYNGEILAVHGDPERQRHLYTIHYRKLLSLDCQGNLNFDLSYH